MHHKSIKNWIARCLLLAAIMLLGTTYSTATVKVVYDRINYWPGMAKTYDGVRYEMPQVPPQNGGSSTEYASWAWVCDIWADITNACLRDRVRINLTSLPVRMIANRAFLDNKKLKVIDARAITQLVSIENLAFCNCTSLDTVYLPEATNEDYYLKEIGVDAFLDCRSLKYVNIPVKVVLVGQSAFRRCRSLPSIGIPYTVERIMDYAFEGCDSLKSIVISTKVGFLGDGVFQNCISMETAEFHNKYSLRIRPLAFDNCKNLKTVKFNYNTIVLIDSCAFRGCTSLRKFTIPASLTQGVGPLAFEGCTALDTVTSLADVPPVMGRDAFRDVSPACVLMVPMGRTQAYRAAGWTEEVFKGGIVEMPAPAGISTIKVKPSDTKYYDLQGRPVTRPEKGRIYIHDGRKVVK